MFNNLFKFRGRLHKKIFSMMLAVGVLPIILAGLFSLYSVINSHNASLNSIEENLINQKIEEINGFVSDAVSTIKLRVGLSDIDKEFRDDLGNQTFLLNSFLNSNAAIQDASFIELSELRGNYGRETTRIIRNSDSPGDFILITKDESREKDSLRDQTNLPKFKVAKEEGEYVSPVYFNSQGPMVTIAALVKPNNNETKISVLSAELSLAEVGDIARRAKLGKTGYLYVVDSTSRVVGPDGIDFNSANNPFIKKILAWQDSGKSGIYSRYENYAGETVAAFAKIIPNLGWGVIAEWPIKDADSIINSLKYQILLFSVGVLIAVIILSVALADKIINPIKKLEEGTEFVAKGKFDAPVDIKTGDEIEDLGVAFNKMTEGLKELQALKDEFVFIAAHELKTPVAAIKGYLSIINDGLAGPVNDKVKDFIVKVLNANARLIRLVEDLLEVARSEAGRIKIDVAPIDISLVIKETMGELKPLADEKSIKVNYEEFAGLPKVLADAGRVREILVNLIGNSIKYTLGSGSVDISHEVAENNLVTHIKDHGIGMSKEAQAKLFTKFYRVATKETANITGTGLGLFIVKQIIEKMGGKIWVESIEGQGSTFSFSLPLAG